MKTRYFKASKQRAPAVILLWESMPALQTSRLLRAKSRIYQWLTQVAAKGLSWKTLTISRGSHLWCKTKGRWMPARRALWCSKRISGQEKDLLLWDKLNSLTLRSKQKKTLVSFWALQGVKTFLIGRLITYKITKPSTSRKSKSQ